MPWSKRGTLAHVAYPEPGTSPAAREDTSDPRGNPEEGGWAKASESVNVGDGTFSTLAASGIIIRMKIVIRNRSGSKAKVGVRFGLANLNLQ